MNFNSAIKKFTSLVDQECDIINQVNNILMPFTLTLPFIEERLSSIEAKLKDLRKINTKLNQIKSSPSYKLAPTSTKKQKLLQLKESNKKLVFQKDRINKLLRYQEKLQITSGKKDDTIEKKVCVLCKCCQSICIIDKGVKNRRQGDNVIKQRRQEKPTEEKTIETAEKKARETAERVAKELLNEVPAVKKEVKTTPLSKKQKKKEKSREANRKRDAEKKEKERHAVIVAQQVLAKQKERNQKRIATERKKIKK